MESIRREMRHLQDTVERLPSTQEIHELKYAVKELQNTQIKLKHANKQLQEEPKQLQEEHKRRPETEKTIEKKRISEFDDVSIYRQRYFRGKKIVSK
jgi:hypothetical protein